MGKYGIKCLIGQAPENLNDCFFELDARSEGASVHEKRQKKSGIFYVFFKSDNLTDFTKIAGEKVKSSMVSKHPTSSSNRPLHEKIPLPTECEMITSLHRSQRHEIQFQVTKRVQNLNLIKFSDPRPPKCAYFHFLLLTYDHFIKPKAENRKTPFLITKRDKKFNLRRFSDPRPPYCGYFHLLLLFQNDRIIPLVMGCTGWLFFLCKVYAPFHEICNIRRIFLRMRLM